MSEVAGAAVKWKEGRSNWTALWKLLEEKLRRWAARSERVTIEAILMAQVKTLAEWMTERGIGLPELVEASGVEERVVDAIAHGRYTPSPEQRQRLAAVLGVGVDEIAWGHLTEVSHVYGHGPQFGRSP